MHIHCLGLNHTTAPVYLRERLAFSEEKIRSALSRLGCSEGIGELAELVTLSTCNRIELYAVSPRESSHALELFLSETQNVAVGEIRPYLYHFCDEDAARHLMEVAAGLDSLVIGEPQILGQIVRALELARGVGATGAMLNRLFQAAISAGKRVRTETFISRNPTSVSSLAANVCERAVHDLPAAQVAILGAGEMAELAVEALRKRGVRHLTVVNRTLERARALAERWDAKADTFENLETVLAQADILVSSTGAPHTIILPRMVHAAMTQRPNRPLVLIDIAVPRDIDPAAGNLPNVSLYDIDHLNAQLENSLSERAAEVPHAKKILEEESARFAEYLNSVQMLPIIADIRQQAESIRAAELQKTMRRLPDLTDIEREHIAALTEALVKKLLDQPTRRLKNESACPHAPQYAAIARNLFGLEGEEKSLSTVAE